MMDKTNKHPHIIALGISPKEIIHYYIAIEGELIDVRAYLVYHSRVFGFVESNRFFKFQLPREYGFADVVDVFFKVHYVFSTEFEPNLTPLMSFLRHYLYKMLDRRQPTNKMKEIWHKITSIGNNNL